jgi:hypothetical protein
MLSTGLECFLKGSNAFDRVGMLSTELEYLCTESERYVQGWNSFYRVGIPLYRVGILSTELEYLCIELECFL